MNSMHLADEMMFLRRVLRSAGGALGAVDTRDVFAACERYNNQSLYICFFFVFAVCKMGFVPMVPQSPMSQSLILPCSSVYHFPRLSERISKIKK